MKIVIEIPKEVYKSIQDNDYCGISNADMYNAVKNGNALPKGHGDLIDRRELLKAIDTWDKFGVDDTNSLFRLDNLSLPHYVPYIHYDDMVKSVSGAGTIIEAESEEEK